MSRRTALPGASELFRRTSAPAPDQAGGADPVARGPGPSTEPSPAGEPGSGSAEDGERAERRIGRGSGSRGGSGRQKHDSKITVYLSADELFAIEQARLTLRGQHRLPVDRGRIVREAVAVLLEDFEERSEQSVLVQRLRAEARSDDDG